MNKKTKKDAGPGKAIAIASAVAAVVIVIVILLLLRSCGAPVDDHSGIEFDPSATEGGWDEADTDEIMAGLNEKVEEGMINISMNTSPVFADGTSKGQPHDRQRGSQQLPAGRRDKPRRHGRTHLQIRGHTCRQQDRVRETQR